VNIASSNAPTDALIYWTYAQFRSGLEAEEELQELVMKDGDTGEEKPKDDSKKEDTKDKQK